MPSAVLKPASVTPPAALGDTVAVTAAPPVLRIADETAQAITPSAPLPRDRVEGVWSWGGSVQAASYAYRPTTIDGVREVFEIARARGLSVGLRGAGRSYGDASLLSEEISLDLTRMNRILSWDPQNGVITTEPGVTIAQLWRYAIGDGWWPSVVSGTMHPTLGGALAMNIHGKNHVHAGPIGDHVLWFDLLLPHNGEVVRCSRSENADLFHGAIGGFGVLGVFTAIALQLKKVESGFLDVEPIAVKNWSEMFRVFEERERDADYLVGWTDCFASGANAGRGLIHLANYVRAENDPAPHQSLRVETQELPDDVLGFIPKSVLWRFMAPLFNNTGMRVLNATKYGSGTRQSGHRMRQTHAEFAFLLDFVPNWKKAYGRHGLIQHQGFVPKENAEAVFREQIALCQSAGIIPYLAVFKRHRPDNFLMTYALDGYSLALDFKLTATNRKAVWDLVTRLDALVIAAGGRFYFAKDSTLNPARLDAFFSEARVQTFLALKRRVDPHGILQTDLYRRIFGGVRRCRRPGFRGHA